MRYLSDTMLIEVYQRAVVLHLDADFIFLVEAEMARRKLSFQSA
ncbi:sporulation histidine kinase inhibitor Sda [Brevibacillus laterosporus]|nr:sporulation histidine kinase inhibitor Sda [Brevibacillus laterosporus]AUM64522.1 sporulation histidine kinase inhibitor Sda [Brevibacillus laterosporus]